MSEIVFLLLALICIGLIYLVHKYFGKEEFYLLAIIYSIVSFLMSFKMVRLLGIDINASVIFNSGLLIILYYFVNRYSNKEVKKLLFVIMTSVLTTGMFLIINSFMLPSVYDTFAVDYQNMVLNSLAIVVLYPVSLLITYLLSGYCFGELKLEKKNKLAKVLMTSVGILFIDTFIFIYFSYAILVDFKTSIIMSLNNYLVKIVITLIYMVLVNKIIKVKKVKE